MKGIAFYNEPFLTIKEDEELLEENIARILLTIPGERVNNPLFGSNLRTFLFSLETILREEVEADILSAIGRWEPRVVVDNIETKLVNENTFSIRLSGTNNDTLEPFTFEQLIGL